MLSAEFHALPAPSRKDLRAIAERVYRGTQRRPEARGLTWEPKEKDVAADDTTDVQAKLGLADHEPLLLECAEASLKGLGLLGDQAGRSLARATGAGLHVPADLAQAMQDAEGSEHPGGFNLHASHRRMGEHDVEHCPQCGAKFGPLVLERAEIQRILEAHDSRLRRPITHASARGPPTPQQPSLPFPPCHT